MTSLTPETQVVLITGASRGIGAATAQAFAAKGMSVIVTELPEHMNQASDFVDSLVSEYVVSTLSLELDVRIQDSIESCVSQVVHKYGKIDILVNNAGVNMLIPSLQTTREQWDWVVDVNLKGTFFMAQSVDKQMVAQYGWTIVEFYFQEGRTTLRPPDAI